MIFRGTPLILQMVFAYDALPHIGIKLPAIMAAGLALACNEAPFIAEMLRAGVLGVDRGQLLAGQALGMTPAVLMRRIIAPQAIRTMIPAFGNESVSALKNSSLASVIAVQELTLRSHAARVLDLRFLLDLLRLGPALSGPDGRGRRDPARLRMAARSRSHHAAAPARRLPALAPGRSSDQARTRGEDRAGNRCRPRIAGRACGYAAAGADPPGPHQARRDHRAQQHRGRREGPAQELQRADRAQRPRHDRARRRGGRAARPQRLRQEHAAPLHQPSRQLGFRHGARRRPTRRLWRGWQAAVAARDRR